jgi:hypothetical protein
MATNDEDKAQQYWLEAEKKLKSSTSVFSSLFGFVGVYFFIFDVIKCQTRVSVETV